MEMTDISKLVGHILSNACLTDNSGLYHGKAGLSLSLFEASKYLKNEELEDKAFNLLQEALILKSGNLSFENGWAGIGYVLCYLIENKFIDADFDEIFGEQYEKIVKNLGDIEKHPERLLNMLQVIYFLSSANRIKKADDRPKKIIQKIFEGLELFFIVQFQDFTDIHYINDKMAVLRMYETCLKLVNFADYQYFSHSVLNDYVDLYRKGRLISSLGIGYQLGMLARKNAMTQYDDVVNSHIVNGARNIHLNMLAFNEKLDALKLISDVERSGIVRRELLPELKNDDLLKTFNRNATPLGYKDGLARFILFCANQHVELL